MDKIWDRNPSKSEVIGRCGRDDHAEPTKSWTLKQEAVCKAFGLKKWIYGAVSSIILGILIVLKLLYTDLPLVSCRT